MVVVSKSEEDDSETREPLKFDSKLEAVDMIRGTKPDSSMNVSESSDTTHVEGEKEVEDQLDAQGILEKDLRGNYSREDDAIDASKSSKIQPVKNLSAPKNASEPHVVTAAADENRPKKAGGRLKDKDSSLEEDIPLLDLLFNKASQGTHDSEGKQHSAKNGKISAESEVDTPKDESGGGSDLLKKWVKHLRKKVDDISSTMHGHLSQRRNMESKRRRHGKKYIPENEVTKSEKTSSVKSFSKLGRGESSPEETPRMSSKRKRGSSSSQHKATEDAEYGDNLVGVKVKVWWPQDRKFYEGVIDCFDPDKKKHKVLYNDGDEESLNFRRERWEIMNDDESHSTETAASPEAASGMKKREKAKLNPELVKQRGMSDVSPKSKSKGTSTKYHEPKLKDRTPKSEGKTDDDSSTVGSKCRNQQTGDKHVNNSSKTSRKSKVGDCGISKRKSKKDSPKTGSKSKQETKKTSMKSKPKTPEAGDDDNPNGMGKRKRRPPKTKETGESKVKIKEKSTDLPRRSKKVKSSEISKVQESRAGSRKKRRRAD